MASDTITPTETTAVFFARNAGLRLLRYQGYDTQNAVGQTQAVSPGLRYEFDKDGYLVIDDERRRQDREFFARYGKLYGEQIDERPAEEWLRDHKLFNVERGFVEMPRVIPDSGPVLEEILSVTLEGDEERLLAIYQEEEAGHNREDVKSAVTKALQGLERLQGGGGSG